MRCVRIGTLARTLHVVDGGEPELLRERGGDVSVGLDDADGAAEGGQVVAALRT